MALTLATLEAEVAAVTGLDVTQAAEKTLIDRWINEAIQEIHGKYDWYWSRDREIVQTVIDVTSGTVSIPSGSTAVTGESTAFTSSDVGKFIQFEGSNDWYKVTAVASATGATIEAPYTGTSDLEDGTYILRKVHYSLSSNAEKILGIVQAISPRRLEIVHFKSFDMAAPFGTADGNSTIYVVWGVDSSGNVQVMLYPHPSTVFNLEVQIKKKATELSAGTDEPAIPAKWRWAIVEGALYRGLRRQAATGSRDLGPSRDAQQRFEKYLAEMMEDSEPDSDYQTVIRSCETRNVSPGPRLPEDFGRGR